MEIISLLMNHVKSRKKIDDQSVDKFKKKLPQIDPKLLNRKSSSSGSTSTITVKLSTANYRKSISIGSRIKKYRKTFYISAENNFTFDNLIFDDNTGEIIEMCGRNKSIKIINDIDPIPPSIPIKFITKY